MDSDIEKRLRRIEARLDRLEALHAKPDASQSRDSGASERAPNDMPEMPVQTARPGAFRRGLSSEDWLQRLGIALLLFGIAFLFKYSIDQGWLTPWVRIGIGFMAGAVLLLLGIRMLEERLNLARTLAGGGMACLYLSVFAAFQLYHLVAFVPAFAAMLLITLAGFILSQMHFAAPMALIAALGGYATPFVLYTGEENLAGLLLYGFLITVVSLALYLRRPWRSLLAAAYIGGWAIMVAAYTSAGFRSDNLDPAAAAILRAGLLGFWTLFLALPVAVARMSERLDAPLLGMILSTAIIGAAFAEHLWSQGGNAWALTWSLIGLAYAGLAIAFRVLDSRLLWSHALTSAMLFSLACWHLFSHEILLLTLALEALALLEMARRFSEPVLSRPGHLLMAAVLYLVLIRLVDMPAASPPLFNAHSLPDLGVVVIAGVIAWRHARQSRWLYGLAAHLMLLLWFYRDLHALTNGQAYASLAWGLQGAALLVLAFRLAHARLRQLAMATLLLVVLKLFIVDLSKIAAIWRVLISLGLGGVFLLLSYYLPGRWGNQAAETEKRIGRGGAG